MKKTFSFAISLSFFAAMLPVAVSALNIPNQPTGQSFNINQIIDKVFNILWPIAVAFCVVMFVIAGFKFVTSQGEPAGIKQAQQAVIWGVVGVAVIILAFSIVFIVQNMLS